MKLFNNNVNFIKIFLLLSLIIFYPNKNTNASVRELGPYEYNSLNGFSVQNKKVAFIYSINNIYYADINGKKFGPYYYAFGLSAVKNNWGFVLVKKGKNYAHINGKDYGPYEEVSYVQISEKKWGFKYKQGGQWFININGKENGPYVDSPSAFQVSDNFWGFIFDSGRKTFVKINDQEFGPYESDGFPVYAFDILNNNWCFSYSKDSKEYVNMKGIVYGPYDNIHITSISENNWGFAYKQDSAWYGLIGGTKIGPFDKSMGYFEGPWSLSDKFYGFTYKKSGKYYIHINDKDYGPYDGIDEFETSKNVWAFRYEMSGKYYYNVLEKVFGPFDTPDRQKLADAKDVFYRKDWDKNKIVISANKWGFGYTSGGKHYLNINGQIMGPYDFESFSITDESWGFVFEPFWTIKIGDYNFSRLSKADEAFLIKNSGRDLNVLLNWLKIKRNSKLQTENMKKYTEPIVKGYGIDGYEHEFSINNFITYGIGANRKLTAAKRASVVKKFKVKYDKLPFSEKDWLIVIGMASALK